jgi:tetratricopeptide (TPR) repeat protein
VRVFVFVGIIVNMEGSKKFGGKFLSLVLVAIVVIAAGYFLYSSEIGRESEKGGNTSDQASTTEITKNGVTVNVPKGSDVNVEQVDINEGKNFGKVPDLNREVKFPASFPAEARPVFMNKLAVSKAELAKTPYDYDQWVGLGQLWIMIEDYDGARLAWEYATKLSPTDFVAFGNLGFLYGYHLNDMAKAETNFLKALSNGPEQLSLYQQTFEFYRDVLKDKIKAGSLLDKGEKVTGNKEFFDKLRSEL